MSDHNNIKHYTASDIERYVSGKMPAAEMHALEQAALEDPFLADAIEGYGINTAESEPGAHLAELRGRLRERTGDTKVVPLRRANRWWVAAAVLILAAAGTIFYTLSDDTDLQTQEIAKNESLIISPADRDSLFVNPPAPAGRQRDSGDGILEQPLAAAESRQGNPKKQSPDKAAVNRESVPAARGSDAQYDSLLTKSEERNPASRPLNPISEQKDAAAESHINTADRSQSLRYQFTGQVVDSSNRPVAGAFVTIKDSDTGVTTDSGGNFRFSLPESYATVEVRSAGFEIANVQLSAAQADNRIRLQDDRRALSKSVAFSKNRTVVSTSSSFKPAPLGGWTNFQQYIEKNKRVPAAERSLNGEVILSFDVNEASELTNFRVDQSLSRLLDAEAIRLVKQGPAWKTADGKTARAIVAVRF